MIIGIDASRAFIKQRTGIEEYSYQVIKHLADKLSGHEVVLYIKKSQKSLAASRVSGQSKVKSQNLPENWKIKVIKWPYLWTQVGLSLEMLFYPVDVLFIPAHIVPIIHPARNVSLFSLALFIQRILKTFRISTYYNQHSDAGGPKNTIVTIHGLEYEFCPKAYSFWERIYMRWSIKGSCRWAKKIIAVSENTKKDLMKLCDVPENKTEVIYEGYEINPPRPTGEDVRRTGEGQFSKTFPSPPTPLPEGEVGKPYLLFLGRLEERKNIIGIIKAFEILKEKYKIPHKLILAGKPGHGFDEINYKLQTTNYKQDIILPGFVNEGEKWQLLKEADIFLFPTFYEGFGLPILEAQSVGVPVVVSNNSSILEIVGTGRDLSVLNLENPPRPTGEDVRRTGEGQFSKTFPSPPTPLPEGEVGNFSALLVNPNNSSEIAEATYKLISDETLKNDIISKGYENVQRFSWDKCASEIAKLLNS
jgi:glycosyltransferase involved in cell wall biosynthesis